jgi:hypothetical protein
MASAREYDELTSQMARLEVPAFPQIGPGVKIDICQIWKAAKPIVELGIKILKLLPFGWATKLADVLQALDNALNAVCP